MDEYEIQGELNALRRKIAELEESEIRYRMVFEAADEAVLVTQDGSIRWTNSKATHMSGYSEDELLSMPFMLIIHSDDRDRVERYHTQRMRGELDKKSYRFRILTKDGTVRWVQNNTSTISWKERPAGLNLLADITEQRQLEENLHRAHDELEKRIEERTTALREVNEKLCLEIAERTKIEEALRLEREQLLAIFDSVDEVISVIDLETHEILYANRFVRDRQGREVVGGVCYKELHGLNEPCDHCTTQIVSLLEGKPYRWDYHNPTIKRDYLATDRIIKWTDGRAAKFHLGIDVTERKNAEKALRESEKRFRELAELLPEPVVQLDISGNVTFASYRALEVFGYTREDLSRGINVHDVIVPEDRAKARENIARILKPEDLGGSEYTCIRKDSTRFPAFIHGCAIISNNTVVGLTSVVIDLTERKRAEIALRESEERFKHVAENTGEWIWEIDETGLYRYCSAAGERILGYSPDELVGKKHFYDLFAPDVQQDLKEAALPEFTRGEAFRNFVNRNVHKNGEIRLLETSGSPILDLEGNLLGYRGADRDITDRRKAEEALRTSEAQLSSAVMMAHLGHWEYDVMKDFFIFNDHFYKIFRTTVEQVSGYTMSSGDYARRFVHVDDRFMVADGIREAIETDDPSFSRQYEHRMLYANGEVGYIAVRVFIVKDDAGRTIKTYGVVQDITERKRVEEALRQSEQRFSLAIEGTRVGIVDWSVPTSKMFWSPGVFAQLGYEPDEFEPTFSIVIEKLIHPDDINDLLRKILIHHNDRKTAEAECRVITKDGSSKWLRLHGHSSWDDQGRPLRTVGTVEDITERKKAEDEIRELNRDLERRVQERTAELMQEIEERKRVERALLASESDLIRSNEDLEQFAYIASHDLQEPMQSVSNALQLLEEEYKGRPTDHSELLIYFAVEQAKKMQALIRDLLEYSRIGTKRNSFKMVDLQEVQNQSARNLKKLIEEKGTKVTWDELPTILGDSTQLLQVFQNLIGNAVKFGSEDSPQVHVSAEKKEHEWVFSVRDNGIGIEREYFDRIFEIFQQLNRTDSFTGTGIGLAVVKKIVERHGGRVWLESELGVGSIFYFTIPDATNV